MWQPLLDMDGATFATVAVKVVACLATLIAAGSALALASLTNLDRDTRRMVGRLGLVCAIAASLASAALIPLGAIYLAGGSWTGAVDPALAGMVAASPVGESLAVRIAGLAVVAMLFISGRAPATAAVAGAGIVCASFAFRGHVLAEPRLILGALLTAHLLGLAFWIGAFAPLHRMAARADPSRAGAAAAEFGRRAQWVVPALAAAGATLLVLLAGSPLDAVATTWGRLLAVKLAVFVLLLGLAAYNRFRLTPALLAGDAGAGVLLRRSIRLEFAAVSVILAVTAVLTTIASPDTEG